MRKIIFLLVLSVSLVLGGCGGDKKDKKTDDKNKSQQEDGKDSKDKDSLDKLVDDASSKNINTFLILDASGSMWGLVDGKRKIDIARNVIKESMDGLDGGFMGLIVYGHRRNGDCDDIEVMVEPARDNAFKILKAVENVTPKGRTPIGKSIEKAAELLDYKNKKSSIILVSDGIESCGVNLCEFADKISSESDKIKIHVIAFDMDESQTQGLKCLANKTGGEFVIAKNSNELGDAFNKTLSANGNKWNRKTKQKDSSKSGISEDNLVNLKILNRSKLGNKMTVSWDSSETISSDSIAILRRGDDKYIDNLIVLDDLLNKGGISEIFIPTKKGEYDVVYWRDRKRILARVGFNVDKTIASLVFPAEVGIGEKFKITWIGPNKPNDIIAIVPEVSSSYSGGAIDIVPYLDKKKGTGYLIAPFEAGNYFVVYLIDQKEVLTREPITVKDVSVKFEKFEKAYTGKMLEIKWKGPNRENDVITISKKRNIKAPEEAVDMITGLNKKNGKALLEMPQKKGFYYVIYWLNGEKAMDRKSVYVRESKD